MKACGRILRSLVVMGVALAVPLMAVHAEESTPDNPFRSPLQVPAPKGAQPISSPLIGVAAAGKRFVAVGQRGDVVYSDDQGQRWTQASVPVSTDLTAVYFPTPEQGWAVGQDGVILHSDDGGVSWSLQMDGNRLAKRLVDFYEDKVKAETAGGTEGSAIKRGLRKARFLAGHAPALALLDVWFRTDKVGFVVGEFNLILKTTDGGKTWTPLGYEVPTPVSHHLYSIRGTATELYIAGERGVLLRRDAGADEFKVIPTPYEGSFFGVAVGGGNLVIFGLQGHAYSSSDQGATWQRLQAATNSSFVAGLFDGSHLVLSTLSDGLFAGDAGGTQLKALDSDEGVSAYGLAAVGPDAVLAVGRSQPRVIPLEKSQ